MITETEVNQFLEIYISSHDNINKAITNLSEAELDFKPAPDKWSIRQILNHLCDSELMAITRMFRIISEENPSLLAYDQNKLAEKLFYKQLDEKAALLIFGLIRTRMYHLFIMLPIETWSRKGLHSEKGEVSLFEMLKTYADHGEKHLQQINNIHLAFTK
ncbi:MAG: DinB family protein [Bacteroidota bacterium]|nr:DinB family protein [Bacteroidota bacterium]